MAPPKPPAKPSAMTGKAVLATIALGLMGATCGASMIVFVPEGGLFADDRARLAVRGDSDAALSAAIDIAGDDISLAAVAGLAHALRAREHAAGDAPRAAAQKALARAGSGQKSPEGLYARALLVDLGAQDPTLQADVAAGGDDAWVLLARARLAPEDERQGLVERAAFTASPTPHATHHLVREALIAGDVGMARAALTRLQAMAPEHPGAAMSALLVAAAEDQALPEKKRSFGGALSSAKAPQARPELKFAEAAAEAASDADRAMLSVWLLALHAGDARDLDKDLVDRVVDAAAKSADIAELALVIALGIGDVEEITTWSKHRAPSTRWCIRWTTPTGTRSRSKSPRLLRPAPTRTRTNPTTPRQPQNCFLKGPPTTCSPADSKTTGTLSMCSTAWILTRSSSHQTPARLR